VPGEKDLGPNQRFSDEKRKRPVHPYELKDEGNFLLPGGGGRRDCTKGTPKPSVHVHKRKKESLSQENTTIARVRGNGTGRFPAAEVSSLGRGGRLLKKAPGILRKSRGRRKSLHRRNLH